VMLFEHAKLGIAALTVTVLIGAGVIARSWFEHGSVAEGPVTDYPLLFGVPPQCSAARQALTRAKKAEEHAHFRAERYPYDPRDGVHAVHKFREAQSCYRASGLPEHASRAGQLASDLIARINVDYASSRLVLENALDSKEWALALSEIHRLLRLTEHVADHAYVAHLWSIVGKVTVHANAAR
jgi:hypothetical protein